MQTEVGQEGVSGGCHKPLRHHAELENLCFLGDGVSAVV